MTDQTAWLKNELERVKKALDLKNEETQLLYLENKKLIEVEQSHKKLVGELYRKIDDLTKESKEMLNYP
jgi:hypothetical protein|tara:strand:+ start:48 stop:254 length:207 start_codon:yes stop_codon:yes gene_type:complete